MLSIMALLPVSKAFHPLPFENVSGRGRRVWNRTCLRTTIHRCPLDGCMGVDRHDPLGVQALPFSGDERKTSSTPNREMPSTERTCVDGPRTGWRNRTWLRGPTEGHQLLLLGEPITL